MLVQTSVSELPSGLYLLVLRRGGEVFSEKLLVAR
ncbi:T9SS type A sorting domain-containing protein [Larkinella soli]|nr:T9SS type A sorting domain-containing protein [Larkinella soli]